MGRASMAMGRSTRGSGGGRNDVFERECEGRCGKAYL